jgi:hypothetical protein
LDLDAIETRANKAAPGPWRWRQCVKIDGLYNPFTTTRHWAITDPHSDAAKQITNPYLILLEADPATEEGVPFDQMPDFQFIAHAREDVPALIAEARRLRGEVDYLRHESQRWRSWERAWVFGGSAPWPGSADSSDPRGTVEALMTENEQLRKLLNQCVDHLKRMGEINVQIADEIVEQIDERTEP